MKSMNSLPSKEPLPLLRNLQPWRNQIYPKFQSRSSLSKETSDKCKLPMPLHGSPNPSAKYPNIAAAWISRREKLLMRHLASQGNAAWNALSNPSNQVWRISHEKLKTFFCPSTLACSCKENAASILYFSSCHCNMNW